MKVFITGIDTGVGKTFFTGMLAKEISKYKRVITFKLVQTGCKGISEDIIMHRRIMGVELFKEDIEQKTCPYVFSFPCSPHLASEIEGKKIEFSIIEKNINELSSSYDVVLIEGAGGICVPVKRDLLIIDWVRNNNIPVIVVSTPKLGSINHTILTVRALNSENIKVLGIFYNTFFKEETQITVNSFDFLKSYFPNIEVSDNIIDFLSFF